MKNHILFVTCILFFVQSTTAQILSKITISHAVPYIETLDGRYISPSPAAHHAAMNANLAKLQKEAQQGNVEAMYRLGAVYFTGYYVQQDIKTALKWYQQAADKGHAGALSELGYFYLSGFGVPADANKAKELYEQAIQKNDPAAFSRLGYLYNEGYGVHKNLEKAFSLFEQAVKRGYPSGMTNVADFYWEGRLGVIDIDKALSLYIQACNQYEMGACFKLALYSGEGAEGLPQDISTMIKLYTIASDAGYDSASNNLGLLYQKGIAGVVNVDKQKAYKYLIRAAVNNKATAQHNLGNLYNEYYGGTSDKLAEQWYLKAVDQGLPAAWEGLGDLYWKGGKDSYILPKENILKAAHWYGLGAAVGFDAPTNQLNKLNEAVSLLEQTEQKAKKADANALYQLANYYLIGFWFPQDKKMVEKYLIQAANQGSAQAAWDLAMYYKSGKEGYGAKKNYLVENADIDKALYWLNVIKKNKSESNLKLMTKNQFQEELERLEHNNKRAHEIENIRKKANKGDIAAIGLLGEYYFYGNLKDNDHQSDGESGQKGFELIERAATQKDAAAQVTLGRIYASEQAYLDYSKAMYWMKQAADQNNALALTNLAFFYQQGIVTEKNTALALTLFEKALQLGDGTAAYQLGILYQAGGEATPQNIDKAIEYYIKGDQLNHNACRFVLGVIYEEAIAKDAGNINKAIYWFERAGEYRHPNIGYARIKAKELKNKYGL